jgi:hypothetical protein
MKERTRVLFELAEQDLKAADYLLSGTPNLAAFHAQQAVEKSLKAMVTELSRDIDEDYLRKRIRHDSIKAVLRVLAEAMIDASRRAGYYGLEATLNRQRDTPEGKLALLLYYAFSQAFDTVFGLFDMKMPVSDKTDYWGDSLKENLTPTPVFDRKLEEGMNRVSDVMDTFWGLMAPALKVEGGLKLSEVATNQDRFKKSLELAHSKLKSEGLETQANAIRRAIHELEMMANPEGSLIVWMRLVIGWAPYLDAHAVIGRYPSQKELNRYQKSAPSVRNLIRVSNEIHQKSKTVLEVLIS